jgi:hypothetical protein
MTERFADCPVKTGFILVGVSALRAYGDKSIFPRDAIAALGHRITFDDDGIAFVEDAGSRVSGWTKINQLCKER